MPLAPVWRAVRPRSERSAGGPVISCFHASSAPSLWRAARAGQLIIRAGREGQPIVCLSALFAPVMARGQSSERALRRRPSYHLPFVSFAHLYGARPSGPACRLPFCSICPGYDARPERASLSFACLLSLPPLWRAA